MKYLLKWMNNTEKEINDAFKPMYNYVIYRQQAHNVATQSMKDIASDLGIDDPTFRMITDRVFQYTAQNSPPSITTLQPPNKPGAPRVISPTTSLSDTVELMHLLTTNVLVTPHLIFDIIEETKTTLDILIGTMDPNQPETKVLEELIERNGVDNLSSLFMDDDYYQYFSTILAQFIQELPMVLVNTKWALKQLITHFFLKHSHKIQLSEVVQKSFELTDISPDVEISKDLKLPYPMNYIEFNKSIPYVNEGVEFDITGALLYQVSTRVYEYNNPTDGTGQITFGWSINNFPKENLTMGGSIHGCIGVDQALSSHEMISKGNKNFVMTSDKAYYPGYIIDGEMPSDEDLLKKDAVYKATYGISLNDSKESHLMGIPKEDVPMFNRTSFQSLLKTEFKQITRIGLQKLIDENLIQTIDQPTSVTEGSLSQIAINGHNIVETLVIDPYTTNHNPAGELANDGEHNPLAKTGMPYIKNETYTVVELVINHKKGYDEKSTSLFSNVGPYLEIGRRIDGDLWSHVQESFEQTMKRSYSETIDSSPFLKAFKMALQSIWFINEPDVKLKEASEVQQSKRKQYFPKRKVTKQRKIVLRGEISRYINSLRESVRSSPKGAFWVRGHWRRQWFPSIQGHKRKWIRPYVKGTGKATKQQVDLEPNTGD